MAMTDDQNSNDVASAPEMQEAMDQSQADRMMDKSGHIMHGGHYSNDPARQG